MLRHFTVMDQKKKSFKKVKKVRCLKSVNCPLFKPWEHFNCACWTASNYTHLKEKEPNRNHSDSFTKWPSHFQGTDSNTSRVIGAQFEILKQFQLDSKQTEWIKTRKRKVSLGWSVKTQFKLLPLTPYKRSPHILWPPSCRDHLHHRLLWR